MHRLAIAAVATLLPAAALAEPAPRTQPVWVTLGTMGGPVVFPQRSQPANAVVWNGGVWLVDAGDGAVQQLAKAGWRAGQVRALFLSHLHFDHTGGVGALLGLRYQTNARGKLSIYGPPGTKALIDGIVASMQPAAEAGYGLPGVPNVDPADTVEVHELAPGETLSIDGATVRVAQNTHYSFAPGSDADRRFKSYSYRFDFPGRSIVYTGDTGPSPSVEALGQGADLLVSEMIDTAATIAAVRHDVANLTPAQAEAMEQHLKAHHLTPEQVGDMAARMHARGVVLTHLAGPTGLSGKTDAYVAAIRARFGGTIAVANDLDRF